MPRIGKDPTKGVERDRIDEAAAASAERVERVERELPRGPTERVATPSLSFGLGRYVLMGTLGRGGMGVVFKAFDPALDRRVAIKVLHREFDRRHAARLIREAQAMAKLSHPHVVQVYEVGEVRGRTFVAMELVHGQTLRAWIRRQPAPSWRESVEVFLQVGAGLAAAHGRGLVHRDFKPSNAIIDDEGRARVLDFGLARQVETVDDTPDLFDERASTDRHEPSPRHTSLTKTGAVQGTPAYMPAEQMLGRPIDARSDQFSFCVALYEAVYGERPFAGDSVAALMASVTCNEVRPAPKGRAVPARLRAVLLRGLAAKSEARWPSMEVLLGQLRPLVAPRRRRWLALGIGVAVGLGLVGAGLVYQADMGQRCTGAREQLEGVWDDARRQAVKTAVLGTELSYAAGTWERVESRLDAYADAWIGSHTEVCEATAVRREQSDEAMDRRMRCLAQRSNSLRATVDVLAKADAEVVQSAVELVAGLPRLSRCDDLDWLGQQDQRVPPPEDPKVAAEVDASREWLADIKVMHAASRYAEALLVVEPVLQRAEVLRYPPLLVEALFWRGHLREGNGQYAEAEQDLQQAYVLAVEHHHDSVALETAQVLTSLVGNRLGRHAEGRQWGRMVALPLARRGGDPLELAQSLNSLGIVAISQGKYEEAAEYQQQSLKIRKDALGPDHLTVADSLGNLGITYGHQGRYEEAQVHIHLAIEIRAAALGADHPRVASSLSSLGRVNWALGEYDKARGNFQRALSISAAALGAEHPLVAMALDNLGAVVASQGEYEEAEGYNQRALEIFEKVLGPNHAAVARCLSNLGAVVARQGEYARAAAHHQRALTIFTKALGADHPHVAASLTNLGLILSRQGEHEQAAERHQRALAVREKALGAEHPDLAYSLTGLAAAAMAVGDSESARTHAERAVSIREAAGVAPGLLAEARFALARALWSDENERVRARAMAEQARETLSGVEGPGESEVSLAMADAWLATHRVQ
ncbi:MAG: serine/threonine-protein kinase [Myxococcota bacterium]